MSDESLPVYLEGLQKIYYPDKVVLDNINLTVIEGETIGILGNNGAGKTTLIRIISSLLLPSYGIIEIFGLNPSFAATQIKQLIGYLPERFSFYPYFSVLEVLEFFSRLHDQDRLDQEDLRERVIKSLDIDSFLHQQIRSLSKGMLHKVGGHFTSKGMSCGSVSRVCGRLGGDCSWGIENVWGRLAPPCCITHTLTRSCQDDIHIQRK